LAALISWGFLASPARPVGGDAVGALARPGRPPERADLPADDRRLDRLVSLQDGALTVGDLVSRVMAECAVPLACDPALGRVRLAVCVESQPARELLRRLAGLLNTHWEAAESTGGYRLARELAQPSPEEVREALVTQEARAQEAESVEAREGREARLQRYRSALPLGRAELLSNYEEIDPWLCADLLDPGARRMLQILASLTPAQEEELLARGTVALSLVSLPAAVRHHLAELAGGRFGPPSGGFATDPDRPSRFESPEGRWANSVVRLTWVRDALRLQLTVPDVCRYETEIGGLPRGAEAAARRRLARLGVAEGTRRPSGEAARAADAGALSPARSAAGSRPEGGEVVDMGAVEGMVDLGPLAGTRPSFSQVLAQIARQCRLSVLAECVGSGLPGLAPRKGVASTMTLKDALAALRTARRRLWWWQVSEGWLVASDAGAEVVVWSDLPDGVLEEWRARVKGAQPVPLEDLARLAAALNPLQLDRLASELQELQQVPLDYLRLYGTLTDEQRAALLRGEVIELSSLGAEQRRVALRRARPTHPWFTEPDLDHATLRLARQTLCTEVLGVTLFLEYHRPESPRDRDVVFVMPLEFRPWGAGDDRR